MQREVVFLKLGGSLITVKDSPYTPRLEVLSSLAGEIAEALADNPSISLLIGHGSGSFGHTAAARYGTRSGVQTPTEWRGFAEVWREARALDQLVVEALTGAGVPVIAFPPSAWLVNGDPFDPEDVHPIQLAVAHGLVPLVQGDAIFDDRQGGTIISTEDVFGLLVPYLKPSRILLAGMEEGVWADFPNCTRLAGEITPATFAASHNAIQASANVDVTGGMRSKVEQMLSLVEKYPTLTARIFSGEKKDNLAQAIRGEPLGTLIHAD